ncbi:hypothetical protein NQ317_005178 [Molorchus minor]|uniref:Tetraspanin n=1 Tax=Molorchus minor TaxID=1323400 RepID=A0ABQ9JC94_9CUCU|nr:hypothetical protein NQ317_005178 [Molorchus minor]
MGCLRDCTSGIAKYILFLLNLLVLICAIALIAMAVIYRNNNSGLDLMSISSYTIAVGVLIALIAFFGCCGAVKESSCLLTTYAGIMLALFIIQAVLGILAFVAVKNGDNQLTEQVSTHLSSIYNRSLTNSEDRDIVNALQRSLECCGVVDSTESAVQNGTGILISSCCEKDVTTCQSSVSYTQGCQLALTNFLETKIKQIGIIAIVFAIVEIIGAIFAFYIRHNIRRKGEYV